MKTLYIIVFIVLAFNVVPSFSEEWVKADDTNWYFDKSRIEFNKTTGSLMVWLKKVMIDSKLKEYRNDYKYGKSALNYMDYSHDIMHIALNCNIKTITIVSGAHYSNSGKVIYSWTNNDDQQKESTQEVMPDSYGESFLNAVCKFASKSNNTK